MCQGGGWEVRLVLRWRGVLSALGADLGRELACVWPFDRPLRQAQDTVRANGLGKGTLADLGRGLAGVRPFDRPLRQAQDTVRANGLGKGTWRTWGEGWLAEGPFVGLRAGSSTVLRTRSGRGQGERVPVDVLVWRVVGRAVRERPLRLRVGGRVLSREGVGRRDVPRPTPFTLILRQAPSTGSGRGQHRLSVLSHQGRGGIVARPHSLLLDTPPMCYRCARSKCYPCAQLHGAKILCCGGNVRRAFVKGSSVAGLREVLDPSRDSG